MANTIQLAFDVLLRDLQEAQHAVVGLLGHHVQDVAEALGAALAPGLVHAEGHVLCALLPAQQLHIRLPLICTFRIIEFGAGEDTNHLRELHHAPGQGRSAVLQVLERLLVDLGVQNIVHGIHLGLPVLLIHVALLLHLADGIAVLLDVHLVGGALHRQPVHLLPQLQDVTLVFAQATLHATHAQVQCSEAARGFGTAKLSLLLHGPNLLEGLLLLLANVVLQSGFCIGHISFQVTAHHGHLVEAVAQRVLRRVQALLRGCQILVRKVNSTIKRVDCLVCVTRDLGLGLLQVRLHRSDVMADSGQNLIHLAPAGIHIQAQRGDHVPDRLDGSIQVIIGFLPGNVVNLRVQLRVHLVLQINDVLSEIFLLLLHLLQGVGHIFHPAVVVLQRFLDVANVQAHGRDLSSHGRLHSLAAGDDGMGGIHTSAHLIQVHIHSIHGCCKVLHVTLTGKDDAADMIHFSLIVAEKVF
mmetsp:Transcript_44083/g.104967  ORF Transcript_44083/g.104967 Transcript_44083/m.104967 type:complete len:469 (-) Transcript_44083:365-1771(-)